MAQVDPGYWTPPPSVITPPTFEEPPPVFGVGSPGTTPPVGGVPPSGGGGGGVPFAAPTEVGAMPAGTTWRPTTTITPPAININVGLPLGGQPTSQEVTSLPANFPWRATMIAPPTPAQKGLEDLVNQTRKAKRAAGAGELTNDDMAKISAAYFGNKPNAETPLPLPRPRGGGGGGGGGSTGIGAPIAPPTTGPITGIAMPPPITPFGANRNQVVLPENTLSTLPDRIRPLFDALMRRLGYQGLGNYGQYGERAYTVGPNGLAPWSDAYIASIAGADDPVAQAWLKWISSALGLSGAQATYPGTVTAPTTTATPTGMVTAPTA